MTEKKDTGITAVKRRRAPKVESLSVTKKGNVLTVQGRPGNVAEYLIGQISLSGKSQAEIAREVGFNMPNMITMLKKNLTKLPIDKIGKMAKSLGVDPIHLYKLCMSEYYPDTWSMIESFLDQPMISDNEAELLEVIRESKNINPKIRTEEQRHRLIEMIDTLV